MKLYDERMKDVNKADQARREAPQEGWQGPMRYLMIKPMRIAARPRARRRRWRCPRSPIRRRAAPTTRTAAGEKKQGKFHIEYINGKPVTVIDTVVVGVRQGPAAERRLRAHREEHRLRVGEPEAGLHAAHPRDREEGAVLMATPTPTAAAAATGHGGAAPAHPAHRRPARRQDRRGAADPRAHARSRSASR